MTDLTTAPITIEEIKIWQESTPADYAEWDLETIGDCDRFLTILIDRLADVGKTRADTDHPFLICGCDKCRRKSAEMAR